MFALERFIFGIASVASHGMFHFSRPQERARKNRCEFSLLLAVPCRPIVTVSIRTGCGARRQWLHHRWCADLSTRTAAAASDVQGADLQAYVEKALTKLEGKCAHVKGRWAADMADVRAQVEGLHTTGRERSTKRLSSSRCLASLQHFCGTQSSVAARNAWPTWLGSQKISGSVGRCEGRVGARHRADIPPH